MIKANIGSKTFRFPETLEEYFQPFRSHVIGLNQEFDSPYGKKKIIYADWTASGRLYQPIEKKYPWILDLLWRIPIQSRI